MTLRLKTRLTLAITLLVLVVLGIFSFYTILNVTHEKIRGTYERGDLIAKQIYEQVKQALTAADDKTPPPPEDAEAFSRFVREILMADPGLDTLLQSTSGYSSTILYLAVTDASGVATAHTDTFKVGQKLPPVEDFDKLRGANALEQLQIIYGQPRIYEIRLPMFDTSK